MRSQLLAGETPIEDCRLVEFCREPHPYFGYNGAHARRGIVCAVVRETFVGPGIDVVKLEEEGVGRSSAFEGCDGKIHPFAHSHGVLIDKLFAVHTYDDLLGGFLSETDREALLLVGAFLTEDVRAFRPFVQMDPCLKREFRIIAQRGGGASHFRAVPFK